MAKSQKINTVARFNELKKDITEGNFKPYYIFMGEEPYYIDVLCDLIIEKALKPEERDFNQSILYASDTTPAQIASSAKRYPVFAERQLIIVKEAQLFKKLDDLVPYIENINPSTVLVLCFIGAKADKRTNFFKVSQKHGEVFETERVRDTDMPQWIESYIKSLGKDIEPQASLMLSEFAGTELRKIVLEIDKLIKSIDINSKLITANDIEQNIGVSKEFNTSELTSALAARDAAKAYRIAYYFGESPKKYPIQMTIGFLFYFFSQLEKMQAIMSQTKQSPQDAARDAGIYYSFSTPYLTAVRNFSLLKTMKIISLIKECDRKSKDNSRGGASDGELLLELIGKILS